MSSFDGRVVIRQAVKLGDGINGHLVGRGPADAGKDWASKYRGKSDTPRVDDGYRQRALGLGGVAPTKRLKSAGPYELPNLLGISTGYVVLCAMWVSKLPVHSANISRPLAKYATVLYTRVSSKGCG